MNTKNPLQNKNFLKIVKSGNTIELYGYEKSPVTYIKKKKRTSWSESERTYRRSDNLKRSQKHLKRLLWSEFDEQSKNPCLITLTYAINMSDLTLAYHDLKIFMIKMKRRFPDITYFAIPEFQKRGAVHFHLVVWGIPLPVVIYEKKTRNIAKLWSHGFIDIVKTDGSKKIVGYLIKYLLKAQYDKRLTFHKAFTRSKFTSKTYIEKWLTFQQTLKFRDFSTVDNSDYIISIFHYNTKYLGEGTYILLETKT